MIIQCRHDLQKHCHSLALRQNYYARGKSGNSGFDETFDRENMIPATLIDNATLHSIILTQTILETLTGITVPRAPQGNTFTYHMNAKEVMMFDMARKNKKQVEGLEKERGVNLDHHHKLNIRNQR